MHVGIAKTFPAFPAYAQSAILRFWHSAYGDDKYICKHYIGIYGNNGESWFIVSLKSVVFPNCLLETGNLALAK